jgi:glycerol kinase
MLYNLNTLDWDDDLLLEFDIPRLMLPFVKSSSEVYGITQKVLTSVSVLLQESW